MNQQFICTASNGIKPNAQKEINLYVRCKFFFQFNYYTIFNFTVRKCFE